MNRILVLILLLISCSTNTLVNSANQKVLSDLLGKKITIQGTAINAKLGALLVTKDNTSIWMSELDSWPNGYYSEEKNGKIIQVTGILIEQFDLPVFIRKEGDVLQTGIPVPEGTDLKEASHRYLLKKAKWKIISD